MEIVGDRPSTIVQDQEAELVRKLFSDFLEMYATTGKNSLQSLSVDSRVSSKFFQFI
jgi:hypothetical protein